MKKLQFSASIAVLSLIFVAQADQPEWLDGVSPETWLRVKSPTPEGGGGTEQRRYIIFMVEQLPTGISGRMTSNLEKILAKSIAVERRNIKDNCSTVLALNFDRRIIPFQLIREQSEAMEAQREGGKEYSYDPGKVTFRFKKKPRITLEEEMKNVTRDTPAPMWTFRKSVKKPDIIKALQESEELNVKVKTYKHNLSLKIDLEHFNEKWNWVAELCHDSNVDEEPVAENNEQT